MELRFAGSRGSASSCLDIGEQLTRSCVRLESWEMSPGCWYLALITISASWTMLGSWEKKLCFKRPYGTCNFHGGPSSDLFLDSLTSEAFQERWLHSTWVAGFTDWDQVRFLLQTLMFKEWTYMGLGRTQKMEKAWCIFLSTCLCRRIPQKISFYSLELAIFRR
jgi:hypothetical protein